MDKVFTGRLSVFPSAYSLVEDQFDLLLRMFLSFYGVIGSKSWYLATITNLGSGVFVVSFLSTETGIRDVYDGMEVSVTIDEHLVQRYPRLRKD
jgi:hypothetical protein